MLFKIRETFGDSGKVSRGWGRLIRKGVLNAVGHIMIVRRHHLNASNPQRPATTPVYASVVTLNPKTPHPPQQVPGSAEFIHFSHIGSVCACHPQRMGRTRKGLTIAETKAVPSGVGIQLVLKRGMAMRCSTSFFFLRLGLVPRPLYLTAFSG